MKKAIFIFLLSGFYGFWGQARQEHGQQRRLLREPAHTHYSVREGLAQTQAFHIFEDDFGYLWISTNYGVSRFDGLTFKNYTPEQLQMAGRVLLIGQYKNDIYFVNMRGVTFIAPDDSITHYPLTADRNPVGEANGAFSKVGNEIYFSCFDHASPMEKGYAVLRFDPESRTYHTVADSMPVSTVHYGDGKKYLLSGYSHDTYMEKDRKMNVYRLENDRLTLLQSVPLQEDIHYRYIKDNNNQLFAIYESEDGIRDLYRCHIENDSLKQQFLTRVKSHILYACDMNRQRTVFGGVETDDGTYIYENGKAWKLGARLQGNHACVTRNGDLWIAAEDGVYNFRKILFESCKLGLSKNDNIWSVLLDGQNNVWFSSFGHGIWMADPDNILHFTKHYLSGTEHEMKSGYMGACMDGEGRVWIAHGAGVTCFAPGNYAAGKILETRQSLALYYDTLTNQVLSGGYGGYRDNFTAVHFIDKNLNMKNVALGRSQIITICRDRKGILRIGTFRGEYHLDEQTQTLVKQDNGGLYDFIFTIACDSAGNVFKATREGVFIETPDGGHRQIHRTPAQMFLIYKNKYGIFGGMGDELYIMDLEQYYRDGTLKFSLFNKWDGFDVLECGQNGGFIDHEGYVWLTGGDRVMRFHPEALMASWRQTVLSPPFVRVVRKENNFSFEVLQAAPQQPERLRFRYRLAGYENDWVATTSSRHFNYQNLPFGRYRLEVQSSLNGVTWSASAFSPEIGIKAPFWLSAAGVTLLSVLFVSSLVLLILLVRHISIRRERRKRQLDRLKYHSVQSKFIPHFTRNVLNSINYLIGQNPESAQKYIAEYADFSNQTLLGSEDLCWTLQSEIHYVKSYLNLEKLRYEERFAFEVHLAPDVSTETPVPKMILQTFCENALKHGLRHKPGDWQIRIEAKTMKKQTVLSVEDNGIGREAAAKQKTEGTHEGLKIIREQLQLYNQIYSANARFEIIDLRDDAGNAAGTRCEVWI